MNTKINPPDLRKTGKIFSCVLLVSSLLVLSGCVLPGVLTPVSPATSTPSPLPATATLEPTPTATPLPTSTPTPEPTMPVYPNLTYIKMVDETYGWGLTNNLILRTSDGGLNWQYVIPAGMIISELPIRGYFLDANTGWIWISNLPDGSRGVLYRTSDGGQNWQSSEAPFGSPNLQFLDIMNGYANWSPGAAAGSSTLELFQTIDGGGTWVKVYAIDPKRGDAAGELPFSGQKSGVIFRDLNHAWATGSSPMEGYTWFFASQDSGKTWRHQGLKLPAGFEKGQVNLDPPRVLNAQEAILPALIVTDQPRRFFYFTRNGGDTWRIFQPTGDGPYDFISIKEGWVWAGGMVHSTKDGGKTWTDQPNNVDVSLFALQIDFINSLTGWALLQDAGRVARLYKTVDGGATWSALW